MSQKDTRRCDWCKADPIYLKYHDEEWGREVTNDHKMFEFLVLESAQAGLNWITILKRRNAYCAEPLLDKYVKNRPYTYCILGDSKDLDLKSLDKTGMIKKLTQEEIFGY